MAKFMVTSTYQQISEEAFLARIDDEQTRFENLVMQGVVLTAFMKADRSKMWVLMNAASQEEVQKIVESLPLYPFMSVEIEELVDFET